MTIYRQGDVLIMRAPAGTQQGAEIPRDGGRVVLAYGEATGHAHAISESGAALYTLPEAGEDLSRLLRLERPAVLRHEEHAEIHIPAGDWIVRRQREYSPEGERQVAD